MSLLVLAACALSGCGKSRDRAGELPRAGASADSLGGGASGGDGATDGGAGAQTGDGEPRYGPLTPYELCLARARLRCRWWAECCRVPEGVETCEAVHLARCVEGAVPDDWDAASAGQCAELEARLTGCARRADDPAVIAAGEVCGGPPYLAGPGEFCSGAGSCEQLPDTSVFCDDASDGAGSLLCELGGPRAPEGGRCDRRTTCHDGLRCADRTCLPLLGDGEACVRGTDCASGHCDGTCDPSGIPVRSAGECRALALLDGHALVAGDFGRPTAVAVDDSHVYWIENFGVFRVPKSGGERETLVAEVVELAEQRVYARALALDDGHVYFGGNTLLGRLPKNGGTAEVVTMPDGRGVYDIATAGGELYFVPSQCRYFGIIDGAFDNPRFIDVPDAQGPAGYLFVDDANVLCASGSQIHLLGRDTREVRKLVDSAYQVGPMHADGNVVYWINADHSGPNRERHLMRVAEAGGSEEVVMTTEAVIRRLHYDPIRALFFLGRDDRVDIYDPAAASVAPLIEGLETRMLLAWDADALYWAMGQGVVRVPKPGGL